uniref:Uncharacterized protein n=1 Tax=Aegilops tauschii TaxID=37682 RepID=M8C1S5_AEGTA
MELQALGSVTARVRLIGRPSGTLPVRMRQAQLGPRRQPPGGDAPPPLVLLVRKLRHGVKLVMSDAVHDVATPCPSTGAGAARARNTVAAKASALRSIVISIAAYLILVTT